MDSDNKSPVKNRKTKSFKFLHKKDKEDRDDRRDDRKKGKDEKKEERKKEKEEKLRAKEEKKRIKRDKKKKPVDTYVEDSACTVFGVPLSVAVDRSPSHDGIRLPVVVRQCIDYIEECGMQCEGIYRLSGVKSKVQHLRRSFNSAMPVCLDGQDPHVVASLLKQFLRELPEPVLTVDMTAHFEDASQIPGWRDRAETIRQLLHRLPTPNSQLVHYILAHMGHIIDREIDTRMNYQNVCIVLSPTMRISHRVLNVFFQNHQYLFGEVIIKRYISPIVSTGEVESVGDVAALQQEVCKQEAVLGHLHKLLAVSPHNTVVQERLWESQRILTLLKRKIKVLQREECEARGGVVEEASSEESQRDSISEATNNSNNSTSIVTTASESVPLPAQFQEESRDENKTLCSVEQITPASPPEERVRASASPVDVNEPITNVKCSTTRRSSSQEIPKLPKPVSGRGERAKLGQFKSVDRSRTNVQSTERPPCEDSEHVTVASVLEIRERDSRAAVTNYSLQQKENNNISNFPSENSDKCTSSDTFNRLDCATPTSTGQILKYDGDVVTSASSNRRDSSSNARRRDSEKYDYIGMQGRKDVSTERSVLTRGRAGSNTSTEESRNALCVDAELVSLVREEAHHLAHHAELLAMNHDLSRKLLAERAEITRLKDEIQELQTLYGYRTYSYDSSESEGGESESGGGGDSDSEEELLQQLHQLEQHNTRLQHDNQELVSRIQEEREAVVLLKARLRQTHAVTATACY